MAQPSALSPLAKTGFTGAALYDKHRPSFPPEAVSSLLSNMHLASLPSATIIDLGAGTGKLTELLAARLESYTIKAVDPHTEMLAQLQHKVATGLGGGRITTLAGDSTHIPAPDSSVDGVIAAQAFHWFADQASLKEIARVLKPGGFFGVMWNIEDYNGPLSNPARSGYEAVLQNTACANTDGAPRWRDQVWRRALMSSEQVWFKKPYQEAMKEWEVWLDDVAFWTRFATLSYVVNWGDEFKSELKGRFLEALKEEGVKRDEQGRACCHGRTYWDWIQKA